MCPSRFHLPAPLGSTVVTRFIATMGTLTPALLLQAPGQGSLITERAFPDIPSPTTPCAPVFRRCFLLRTGLAPDSPCSAVGGSSDFVHCSQSHQSHQAVSSLSRGRTMPISSTDYLFVSSCSPHPVAGLQLLSTRGGKHHHRGTFTLQCSLSLKRTSAEFIPLAASLSNAERNKFRAPGWHGQRFFVIVWCDAANKRTRARDERRQSNPRSGFRQKAAVFPDF